LRALLALALGLLLLAAFGCDASESKPLLLDDPDTRLDARPRPSAPACAPGRYELRVAAGRRAIMLVTPARRDGRRALLLALHGAGSGGAPGGLYAFRSAWNLPGLILVAPAAAGTAWTLDRRDIGFVDRALQRAFARCRVDPRRVGVGGFSSGAGLTLWLGLTNGDLFRALIVQSGGGSLPNERVGKPRIFIAHGIEDSIIPIGAGGDRVARELESEGYAVTYRRFAGGHRPQPDIGRTFVRQALLR
jgi:poly(3-hydroxybutyrate) depolymerase